MGLFPSPTRYALAQLTLSGGFCNSASLPLHSHTGRLGGGRNGALWRLTSRPSRTSAPVLLSDPLCTSKLLASFMSFFHCVFPPGAFIMSWARGVLNGRKTGNLTSLKFKRLCQGLFSSGHHTQTVWGAVPVGSPRSQTDSKSGLRAELCQASTIRRTTERDFPRATVAAGWGSPWERWAPRGGSAPATHCPALGLSPGSSFKFLLPFGPLCFPLHTAQ